MKKLIAFYLFIFLMMSCGGNKNTQYEMKVDNVPITNRTSANATDFSSYSNDEELSQIFEVIPGNYTINTNYISEGINSGADANINIKFRLLKPVQLRKDDSISENNFKLYILDADDKVLTDDTGYPIGDFQMGEVTTTSNGKYLVTDFSSGAKDAITEFKDFLQSEVGSEVEITFGKFLGMDSHKYLKNATGLEFYIAPSLALRRDGTLWDNYWKWKE